MRMNAVLSNPKHPEYGQFTVPLPIPHNQYDGIMEALNAMDMGDPLARDCQMDEILGEYPILKRLEGKPVNIDELDYLAKRLDSFCCALEDAQFQGAAVSYDYSDMADLINLTFSCQEVTVITDFSDLEQVGREHFMVLNGGCASKEELDNLDGYETALLLIDEGDGVVTPYGVVYDNGMCLSQVYDGRHFPQYFYEPPLLTLTVQESKGAPQTWLYLPAPDLQIKRSLIRAGIVDPADMELSFQASEFPDAVDCVLDMESESLEELNKLCRSIQQLSTDEIKKLGAVVEYAQPETAAQVRQLAENLEQFDYAPSVQNVEEYPILSDLYDLIEEEYQGYDADAHQLYTAELLQEILLGLHSMCKGAEAKFFNGHTNVTSSRFIVFGVKGLLQANRSVRGAMLFNILSFMSDRLLTIGNTTAVLDELYVWLSDNITVGTTIIEYIRNILKRVRKKESNLIMASQNLEDFDREGIRELTKPLFAIPPHQFIFNCGSIDKRFYMDLLQLEEAEYNLIRFPQRGVCLFKCGNERYLLEVHAPAYKEALYGSAGGR